MSSEIVLLTYKELADRLGVKLASARQTVSRRRWKRIKGNDGSTRIEVPTDYLQRPDNDVPTVVSTVDHTVEIARLSAENEYLKKRVSDIEADRDAWKHQASRSFLDRLLGRG